MLEDSTMDPKKIRPLQQQKFAADSRTKDASQPSKSSSGLYKSSGLTKHLQDSLAPSGSTKADSLPKGKPLKDKRGFHRSSNLPRRECSQVVQALQDQVADDLGENVNGRATNKKPNLNHLLNFYYAPRQQIQYSAKNWRLDERDRVGWGYGSHGWGLSGFHPPKFNKEHFIQANCQFLVKSCGNYAANVVDPDLLVEWDMIEQVHIWSTEKPNCPICLSDPCAAKMTRCGHIYCWPCILHYLALSDDSWRKCPICFEAVHKGDLKSVVVYQRVDFGVNKEITMKLMRREKGSLLAYPVEEYDVLNYTRGSSSSPNVMIQHYVPEKENIYSKLLLVAPDQVVKLLHIQKGELDAKVMEEYGCPELCFVEEALTLLESELHHSQYFAETQCKLKGGSVATAEQRGLEILPPSNAGETGSAAIDNNLEKRNASCSDDAFYFYQVDSGSHIYLNTLNAKMLEKQFGSLSKCPLTIKAMIIEKEAFSVTEDMRRKIRFLQHLPLSLQYEMAELQMDDIVSIDVMDFFHEKLKKRLQYRQRREREERRREKRIIAMENKKIGRFPSARLRLNSNYHFPQPTSDAVPIPDAPETPASTPSVCESRASSQSGFADLVVSGSPADNDIFDEASPPSNPSFAEMLRTAKNRPDSAELVARVQALKMEFPALGQGSNVRTSICNNNNSDDSDDLIDEFMPPEYHQSFSNAISMALEKVQSEVSVGVEGCSGSKKGGKKKKKQKLLFATNRACSSK